MPLNPAFLSDFSKWVAVRFLRVAAAPGCDVIHGRVSAVLCSLLHTLRVRVPLIFSRLTQDLLFLTQELCDILYVHITAPAGAGHSQSQWPVTLKSLSFSSACTSSYLTPSPLVIPSPAALESLTAVAIGVITDSLRGVVSCRGLTLAWETACFFLANGNIRLRKLSMVMVRKLVELRGFPPMQNHEFFTAFFHLLETHSHPTTASTNPNEEQLYEGELLKLSRCVFQSSHVPNFEPTYLSQMFECVCALGGSDVTLGTEVTDSLCLLFSFSLSCSPVYESTTLLRRQRVTDVCRTLACTVGTENQADVIIYCLWNHPLTIYVFFPLTFIKTSPVCVFCSVQKVFLRLRLRPTRQQWWRRQAMEKLLPRDPANLPPVQPAKHLKHHQREFINMCSSDSSDRDVRLCIQRFHCWLQESVCSVTFSFVQIVTKSALKNWNIVLH